MKFSLAIAALTFIGAISLRGTVLVTLDPQTQTIAPGSSTSVQVAVSGLGLDAPPSLGAFDLDVAFDPTIVTFTGLTFGDPFLGDQLDLSGTGSISDFSTPASGVLEFYEISLDPPTTLDSQQPDSFILATLQFQALASGTTSLIPSLNSVSDSEGGPLDVALQSGSIEVVATPEPRSGWLVLAAGAWMTRCRFSLTNVVRRIRRNHFATGSA